MRTSLQRDSIEDFYDKTKFAIRFLCRHPCFATDTKHVLKIYARQYVIRQLSLWFFYTFVIARVPVKPSSRRLFPHAK